MIKRILTNIGANIMDIIIITIIKSFILSSFFISMTKIEQIDMKERNNWQIRSNKTILDLAL